MNRRTLLVSLGAIAGYSTALTSLVRSSANAAGTQSSERMYRIGYLTGGSRSSRIQLLDALRQGMKALGYVEGRNLVLDARFSGARFERLPALAQELIKFDPDVLVASTTPGALAAKAATRSIPIVFVSVADPIGVGLVSNLARPTENVTGITNITARLSAKRLELLKEMVPTASRVAVIVNPNDPNTALQMRNAGAAANALGVQLQPVLPVRGIGDLEGAFKAAVRAGAAGALRMVDPTALMLRGATVALAAKYRLPVIYAFREDVEAGGLLAYGTSLPAQYRQIATLIHKIIRGARPADLPVEQPTVFELVVNLKATRALGLTIPPSILARANEVIE